jgi:hypothetical protein
MSRRPPDTPVVLSHGAEMIYASEMFPAEFTLIPLYAMLKGFQGHEIHDLGKHKRA